MTLHEEQERVQKAVSNALAHVQEDPWLTQRVLANAKGEEPVKRKISLALVLCIALGVAIIGTACALLASSQVADFFGQHWNQELGESLQQGKVAQIGESVTIGDVVFTLEEIVYKDRALYGVGTARPVKEKDVIIPMDMAEDPEFFAMNGEALALAEQAKTTGGRMFATSSMPLKIGVDEGTMLMPGSVGYYDVANGDGSVTFSFEASDGFAVNEGTSYQIRMESDVRQIDEDGRTVEGTMQRTEWTVSCTPVVLDTGSGAPDALDTEPAVIERGDYELLVPDAYRETGTMPVYRAIETDFTAAVDPEWFNHSGIRDGADKSEIRFKDHAILSLSPEALFYCEFTDDEYTEAPSARIVGILWIRDWEGHTGEFTLEKTALSGITLGEAKVQAVELINRLGLDSNQYVCIEALDMSLERIQSMGAIWEKAIADGELLVDDDHQPYDYRSIPAGEEGYYLRYSPLGVDTFATGGQYSVDLYVNSRGIVNAAIRNPFTRGETVSTPEKLITPDAALAGLAEKLGRSLPWYDKHIRSVEKIALVYEAVRADNKTEGMAFVPAWMILYRDETAERLNYNCYAFINAVDGTMIDASFR